MDIDHIVSRQALRRYISAEYPEFTRQQVEDLLRRAPSIAIPSSVHRGYSETYGGRNTVSKQQADAKDLSAAVDSNLDAISQGLIEYGFSEVEVEIARENIHSANKEQGWYE